MENELEGTRKMFIDELTSREPMAQWSPELLERLKKYDVGIDLRKGEAYARGK